MIGLSQKISAAALIIPLVSTIHTASLADQLKGKILLQVESKGEAWYVNPTDNKRYYLPDGDTAYSMLRTFGLGISNANLKKIPIQNQGIFHYKDSYDDSDDDWLADKLEEAIGTDPHNKDTDGDSYIDGDEVINGYNPLGAGKMSYDTGLAKKLSGRILLQTEGHGEAWYVNPGNNKRYYLQNGEAAYQIMRYLGLGITDADLAKIPSNSLNGQPLPMPSIPATTPISTPTNPTPSTFNDYTPPERFFDQIYHIGSLRQTLEAYHYSLGEYPPDLAHLITTSKELATYCNSNDRDPALIPSVADASKIQCGNHLWSGNIRLATNDNDQIDSYYTHKPYIYKRDPSTQNFQLTYQLSFYTCEQNSYCSPLTSYDLQSFINGSNTADKDYISTTPKTSWKQPLYSEDDTYLQEAMQPEKGLPTLSNLKIQVFPQPIGDGRTMSYVTVTWDTDIEAAATIAFGSDSQQLKQEYFVSEDQDRQLRKDHRIDFALWGTEPIHYVISSCFNNEDSSYRSSIVCIRTADATINPADYPTVTNGPETITNSPIVADIKFTPNAKSTTISWDMYPAAQSQIYCSVIGSSPSSNNVLSAESTGDDTSTFSAVLPLIPGQMYHCYVTAYWIGSHSETRAFPILYSVPK